MKQFLKTGLLFILICLFAGFSSKAQNKIVSYQYWFDNDYNTNIIVSLTPAVQVNLTTLLPLENINGGLHIITIRFKDINGKWSVPVNQYFYKSSSIMMENKISAYRYWLNEDIADAEYTSLSNPVTLLNLNKDLDFSGLNSGEYVIHFQFRDASGQWSLVTSDKFTLINVSALETTDEKAIGIYPNPTTGLVRIESYNEFPTECTLEVCDYYGRIVLVRQLKNERSQEINLSHLAKGIYNVRIKNNNGYIYKKIILQ